MSNGTIYVSGAPGNVGTELVRLLSNLGGSVRALVHRPQDGARLRFPGVTTTTGDLTDPLSFADSLSGADRVFVNSSVGEVILAQKNLIDAAARAGVRHIVKLSWVGASDITFMRYFGQWHADVEQHLIDSGISYTILRANDFMQNYLPQITARAGGTILGISEGKAAVVDARDVAAVAASVLTGVGHEGDGEIYEVSGPEALSKQQLAQTISQVAGRRVAFVRISPEEMADTYHRSGWPEPWAQELVAAAEFQAGGHLERVTDVVEKLAGVKPVTFRQFVQEFAPARAAAS